MSSTGALPHRAQPQGLAEIARDTLQFIELSCTSQYRISASGQTVHVHQRDSDEDPSNN